MATLHIQISDTTPRISYSATAGQTMFDVPFAFFSDADLKVYVNDVLKALTTDYTVSGAGDTGGGSITFTSGLTLDDSVVIVRDIAIARTTDFPASGPFNADPDLNTELDRIVAMLQQLEDSITRTLRLNDSDVSVNVTIPAAGLRANGFLAFDADGDPIIASGASEVPVSTFMETVLDDTSAAAARGTLGIADSTAYTGYSNWLHFR